MPNSSAICSPCTASTCECVGVYSCWIPAERKRERERELLIDTNRVRERERERELLIHTNRERARSSLTAAETAPFVDTNTVSG